MCGRYSLTTPVQALRDLFGFDNLLNLPPRYNIAPTQEVPVVRRRPEGARDLALLRWGLIPSWARDKVVGARCINARAETLAEKPAFRGAFAARRCLIPADGFYEWESVGKGRKQPWRIVPADGGVFAFAGLWERWSGDGDIVESCSIVTVSANATLRRLHQRMPAILPPAAQAAWLDPAMPAATLQTLLQPLPDADLRLYPVAARVGNVRFDDPDCAAPLAETPRLL